MGFPVLGNLFIKSLNIGVLTWFVWSLIKNMVPETKGIVYFDFLKPVVHSADKYLYVWNHHGGAPSRWWTPWLKPHRNWFSRRHGACKASCEAISTWEGWMKFRYIGNGKPLQASWLLIVYPNHSLLFHWIKSYTVVFGESNHVSSFSTPILISNLLDVHSLWHWTLWQPKGKNMG